MTIDDTVNNGLNHNYFPVSQDSKRTGPGLQRVRSGGLRSWGRFDKKSTPGKPLISVITVARNAAGSAEQTIQSVLNQTYDNIEYILIDGASTDGTVDIVRKYEKNVACWLSEPDKGIYEAMNKGIDLATGDWINFMNAGDLFYGNDVIEAIFKNTDKLADVIYGDHLVVYNSQYSKIQKAGKIEDMWKGMAFCHQSSFVKTSLMKKYRFNCKNRIAADFEVLYTLALKNHSFRHAGLVVSSVTADGLSGINTLLTVKEQWKVVRRLSNSWGKNLFYIYLTAVRIGKNTAKAILPQDLVNRIRLKL